MDDRVNMGVIKAAGAVNANLQMFGLNLYIISVMNHVEACDEFHFLGHFLGHLVFVFSDPSHRGGSRGRHRGTIVRAFEPQSRPVKIIPKMANFISY